MKYQLPTREEPWKSMYFDWACSHSMSYRHDFLPPNTGGIIHCSWTVDLKMITPTSLAGARGREGRTELLGSWPVQGGASQKGASRCGVLGRKEREEALGGSWSYRWRRWYRCSFSPITLTIWLQYLPNCSLCFSPSLQPSSPGNSFCLLELFSSFINPPDFSPCWKLFSFQWLPTAFRIMSDLLSTALKALSNPAPTPEPSPSLWLSLAKWLGSFSEN